MLELLSDFISIEGPIEIEPAGLTLRIPLDAGGRELAPYAKGIGGIEGDDLVVVIKPWLADKLRVGPNSLVVVDNIEGKFRITRSAAND